MRPAVPSQQARTGYHAGGAGAPYRNASSGRKPVGFSAATQLIDAFTGLCTLPTAGGAVVGHSAQASRERVRQTWWTASSATPSGAA